ncbi:daunorubicin resistance protein DrrA family ABC transporter ATP-binding protein [Ornithinibacillus scapharcae]|uniref:daunorubicin resistance protein DrrA family ABC transporter ATP-binding protein n=1 Tax=Ornithinibacillus scapharcae TaxID=1147159 RepID=UPI000225BDE7|nr:daunorubicin resistance protein DrrA family ABC transporter ATP-binding protein [Ornithinibacillus scapharcae]
MNDAIISVKDLKKFYGSQKVLDGINFEVERGQIFALLGENGAGKTTTIRILSTLIRPDEGIAMIDGLDTSREANEVRKRISLTGQYATVDELLTGEENLQMMGHLNHLNRSTVKKRTATLLRQFDLLDAAKKQAKSYSGGMRRRLDIALGLLANPKVIFLDEPTTGLDPRSRLNMWTLIQELAKNGTTIFLTTQYLEEADQLADKIALIHNGKIVVEGTATELKKMIGEEKLVLQFQSPANLMKAHNLLDGQLNHASNSLILTAKDSTEDLRNTLNTLHEQDMMPIDIYFRKPTLEDVFMEITSHKQEGEVKYG